MNVMKDANVCEALLIEAAMGRIEMHRGAARFEALPFVQLSLAVVPTVSAMQWWRSIDDNEASSYRAQFGHDVRKAGWLAGSTPSLLVHPARWRGTVLMVDFWFTTTGVDERSWPSLALDIGQASLFLGTTPTAMALNVNGEKSLMLQAVRLATQLVRKCSGDMETWRAYLDTWLTTDVAGKLVLFGDMTPSEQAECLTGEPS